MANSHETLTDLFIDIASAIKEKTGSQDAIVADTFPDAIRAIEAGGSSDLAKQLIEGTVTDLVIPDSVTIIGYKAFYDRYGLTSVVIPDSVTSIGARAFSNCISLTSVEIGGGVTTIGSYAFDDCDSLTSVLIPDNVTTIGSYAFSYCGNLTSVVIGNGVTSIGESAFDSCSNLTSVTIGDSVTSIGDDAFASCSNLTSVVIPDGVTSIGSSAFSGCGSLTSIEIPDSVTSIGGYAFGDCSSLTSITILGNTVCSLESANAIPSVAFVYVPEELLEEYKSADEWCDISGRIKAIGDESGANVAYIDSGTEVFTFEFEDGATWANILGDDGIDMCGGWFMILNGYVFDDAMGANLVDSNYNTVRGDDMIIVGETYSYA